MKMGERLVLRKIKKMAFSNSSWLPSFTSKSWLIEPVQDKHITDTDLLHLFLGSVDLRVRDEDEPNSRGNKYLISNHKNKQ